MNTLSGQVARDHAVNASELPKIAQDGPNSIKSQTQLIGSRVEPTKPSTTCLVCGEDIGHGHSNYRGKYCGSCGPKLSIVKATAKSLMPGFTVSQIYEELAMRGRPPRIEHIPAMLRDLGYSGEGCHWKAIPGPPQPRLC